MEVTGQCVGILDFDGLLSAYNYDLSIPSTDKAQALLPDKRHLHNAYELGPIFFVLNQQQYSSGQMIYQ